MNLRFHQHGSRGGSIWKVPHEVTSSVQTQSPEQRCKQQTDVTCMRGFDKIEEQTPEEGWRIDH